MVIKSSPQAIKNPPKSESSIRRVKKYKIEREKDETKRYI